MEEIRESRKSMEQERVAHLPLQKNDVLESVLKVGAAFLHAPASLYTMVIDALLLCHQGALQCRPTLTSDNT